MGALSWNAKQRCHFAGGDEPGPKAKQPDERRAGLNLATTSRHHAVQQTGRATRSLANDIAVGFADLREGCAHPYFLTLYAYRKIELLSYTREQVRFFEMAHVTRRVCLRLGFRGGVGAMVAAAILSHRRLQKDTDDQIA
jgi:hypothetical protein